MPWCASSVTRSSSSSKVVRCAAILLGLLLLEALLPARSEAVFGANQLVVDSEDLAPFEATRNTSLAISSGGVIFVAATMNPVYPGETMYRIEVYRSDDGGDTWNLWGTLQSTLQLNMPLLRIVPTATGDRLYLAYNEVGFGVIMVRSDVSDTPSWAASSVPGANVLDFDFVSDVRSYTDFVLHLVWTTAETSTATLHYSRSTDQGQTWSTPYSLSTDAAYASLAWGHGDLLHCAYTPIARDHVFYRQAVNRVADGIADWSAEKPVWATPTGGYETTVGKPSIAAHTTSSNVLVAFPYLEFGFTQVDMSSDDGATWNAGDYINQYGDMYVFDDGITNVDLVAVPGLGGFDLGASSSAGPEGNGFYLWKSGPADPMGWSSPLLITGDDVEFFEFHTVVDPSRPWLTAHAWQNSNGYFPSYPTPKVMFNADWLGTSGFPLFDPWPVTPIEPPVGPPSFDASLAVFEDAFANIHMMSADGSEAPGWPVSAGGVLPATQVGPATGDMNLDGTLEVVEGTPSGQLHLFEQDGSEHPGWPVDLGTQSDVYACLAPMEGSSSQQVVACSGDEIHVLDISGQEAPGYPLFLGGQISGPPSVGDLNGNDTLEVVFPWATGIQAYEGVIPCFLVNEGFPVSRQVELADLDGDGKPELVVVGETGEVDLRLGDGTRHAGSWPFVAPNNTPVTEVAVGDLDGDGNPDLVFADAGWNVYALHADGTSLTGWPMALGPGQDLPGSPAIANLDSTGAEVVLGMSDGKVRALHADGTEVFGWPKDVGSAVREPVAAGDVDGDGKEEVLVVGDSTFSVIGVNNVPAQLSTDMWPMAGANPERTGCLDCLTLPTTGVPEAPTPETPFAFRVTSPGVGRVTLHYALPTDARVDLILYDVAGRRVRTLLADVQAAGEHRLEWDGRTATGAQAASGIYYARLRVRGARGTRTASRKIAYMR